MDILNYVIIAGLIAITAIALICPPIFGEKFIDGAVVTSDRIARTVVFFIVWGFLLLWITPNIWLSSVKLL